MQRSLLISTAAAIAVGLLTTASSAAPGPLSGLPVGSDMTVQNPDVVPVRSRGGGFRGFRRGGFAIGIGVPLYSSYRDCWWSRRYHRTICNY